MLDRGARPAAGGELIPPGWSASAGAQRSRAAAGYSVGGTVLAGDGPSGTGSPDPGPLTTGPLTTGLLAPGLLTTVLLTTDADLPAAVLGEALAGAGLRAGTALLLASGASGTAPDPAGFAGVLAGACAGLTRAAA